VRLPEFIRTTTFRWALLVSGAFAVATLLICGFVYWRAAAYTDARIDRSMGQEASIIAAQEPGPRAAAIEERLRQDPRRVKLGGLFGRDGARIVGNIERLPAGFEPDGNVQTVVAMRVDAMGREEQTVRALGRRLPDGQTLVIARNVDELPEIAEILGNAAALGLIPALALGVAIGIFLSLRAQNRVTEVNRKVQRIVAGDLRERLPATGTDDPFDKLAGIVNGMLDEIEALIESVAGVGNDIAHDLRTPLTRVRISLERARQNAGTLDQLRDSVDQAIGGLDQSLAIITALLRIAEIEQSRRLAGFGDVHLAPLVREVGDLYEPIAEDKRVGFSVTADHDATVRGDRDLLFEAIANLVDNAVKFTPEGGRVELTLERDSVVQVRDTGPGITVEERDLVARRFYRSDKSRRTPGLGLGLSLVAAIAKLHGFRFSIAPGPGCIAQIVCRPQQA